MIAYGILCLVLAGTAWAVKHYARPVYVFVFHVLFAAGTFYKMSSIGEVNDYTGLGRLTTIVIIMITYTVTSVVINVVLKNELNKRRYNTLSWVVVPVIASIIDYFR